MPCLSRHVCRIQQPRMLETSFGTSVKYASLGASVLATSRSCQIASTLPQNQLMPHRGYAACRRSMQRVPALSQACAAFLTGCTSSAADACVVMNSTVYGTYFPCNMQALHPGCGCSRWTATDIPKSRLTFLRYLAYRCDPQVQAEDFSTHTFRSFHAQPAHWSCGTVMRAAIL